MLIDYGVGNQSFFRSIRTGKELILYTPSFLTTPITDQRLDQRKSDDPSMEKEFEEENIDEEILPDSSETAQIQQEKAVSIERKKK